MIVNEQVKRIGMAGMEAGPDLKALLGLMRIRYQPLSGLESESD